MENTIENRKKIKQDRALNGKASTYGPRLLKKQYLNFNEPMSKVHVISLASSQTVGEVHPFSKDQKAKFYKIHHSRDYNTNNDLKY